MAKPVKHHRREPAGCMVPELYRVLKAWRETHDTFSLTLEPV